LGLVLNNNLTLRLLFFLSCLSNLKFFDEMDEDGSEYNNLAVLNSMLISCF